ncbi:hypothetical protein NPIL_648891 [Nephila pilipes]|uniref:Uncharacterized protein n=1 Tax=Nephila pilipes TaxID=299642 RepID=A0A8X6P9W5_NEPPI|nr:hypothetical protein NPIL_648891 [Nephila pilipes]
MSSRNNKAPESNQKPFRLTNLSALTTSKGIPILQNPLELIQPSVVTGTLRKGMVKVGRPVSDSVSCLQSREVDSSDAFDGWFLSCEGVTADGFSVINGDDFSIYSLYFSSVFFLTAFIFPNYEFSRERIRGVSKCGMYLQ